MDKVLMDKGNDIKQKSADVDSHIKDAVVAKDEKLQTEGYKAFL